jgi:putative hydrolase of the HAD superfamily
VSPACEIETIFWDIGGVLLTNGWDKDQRADVLCRLGVDLEDYESRHDAANFYWERGLSTAKRFFDQTVFTEPRDFSFEDLWSLVCAESRVLHPECFDILGTLAADGRFKIATLNNESRELNDHRVEAFQLRDYFDYFICSGYVHEMKPDAAIYRSAIEISGYRAEQAIFIDDKQENCDAAMGLDMQAIRFESPAQLRDALAQLGIQAA